MAGINGVFGHMVDDDRLAALPDFVANRALDLEFPARLQSEIDVVAHAAGDPAILGDPGDRGEAHPGRATHDVEDRRDRLDGADSGNILCERFAHRGVTGVRRLICWRIISRSLCRGAGAKIKEKRDWLEPNEINRLRGARYLALYAAVAKRV